MKRVAVLNVTRERTPLGSRVEVADTFWTRLKGLLGAPPLEAGEGMLLDGCQAVHMFGMKQPLDVAFLGRDGEVVAVYHDLRPGQRSKYHGQARQALELPVGTLRDTQTRVGDHLAVRPVSNGAPQSDGEYDDQ